MGFRFRLATAGLALLLAHAIIAAQRQDPPDDLARVRLIVSTRAASATITVSGATIASFIATINSAPPSVTVSRTGRLLQLSRNVAGETAEAQFDVMLADVGAASPIVWTLATDAAAESDLAVYALSDQARPALVDRFNATTATAQFTTRAALVTAPPIRATRFGPPLVLAHYYPWYTTATWSDPQLADRPLRIYSTDAQTDVNAAAAMAHAVGIDAWVVSWQGLEADNGFNDRRMRIALDAAAAAGMRACAYTETYVANPTNDPDRGIDPRTLFDWLVDIVDRYGSHPAYLRVDGRPVILTYAASLLPAADWADVIARLRRTGRNPLIVGEFSRSVLLDAFDGEYQYSNVFSSGDVLADLMRGESLRVRTIDLLRPGDRRRVWVASVTPGFDDSRLVARPRPRIVDRADGAVYDDQWSKAIDTGADWIVVTSWNEWWENTEIEPGARYGTVYLERTKYWTQRFKALSRTPPPIVR
ncbi:MAG TPA: endo-1,3-alpha-glucanase family glycosylhydrolase [Vicinamibacterales bacterium]|nr:endo-1,3-alpha-glucanase family glycosylhydrolase [Vicinamibacterales bacterium]